MGFFNWSAPAIRRYGERWTDDDLSAIAGWLGPHVADGGRLLDVGGGSGGLARRIVERTGAHVTVLDPTPELVAHIPVGDSIDAILGTAEDMPFADDAFDALIVTDAFHHFRDLDASVREMARVVRPAGLVLVLELDRANLWIKLIGLAERLVGEPAAFFTPGEMCAFMAERGIVGQCTREHGASYRFMGTTEPDAA